MISSPEVWCLLKTLLHSRCPFRSLARILFLVAKPLMELFPYACLTSCYWRLAAALSTSARQEGGPQHSCCGHLGTSPPWSREVFLGFVSNMTMMTWIRSLSCTFVKDYFIALDPLWWTQWRSVKDRFVFGLLQRDDVLWSTKVLMFLSCWR